jgi:hypothetical protein
MFSKSCDEVCPVPVRTRHSSIRDFAIEQLSYVNELDTEKNDIDDAVPVAKPIKTGRPKLQVRVFSADFDHEASDRQLVKTPSVQAVRSDNGELIIGNFIIGEHGLRVVNHDGSKETSRKKVAITSRTDFAEIRTLGSGTHGIVVEALHIPSMTLVAIKMISINTDEHLHTVNSELHVSALYTLSLLD